MPDPLPSDLPLNERSLTRIAAVVVAAPVLCCGAGLAVLVAVKHRGAVLLARYAGWHVVPVPVGASGGGHDAVPGFLAGMDGARFVFARNPAEWTEDAGFVSFFLTSLVLVAAAVLVYGVVARRPALLLPAAVPLAVAAWMTGATVRMFVWGHEVALDPVRDALTVNGRRVGALTGLRGFTGYETRNGRGRVSWFLDAVLADGGTVDVGGPDAPHNVVEAAPAMNAALARVRGPAVPDLSRPPDPAQAAAEAAVARVLGVSPPSTAK